MSINPLWLIPIIAVYATIAWFIKLYLKDKDKRKLMFFVVFLVASMDYIVELIGIPLTSNSILSNFYLIASIPLQIAILIAVTETLYKIENFDKAFKIFSIIIVLLLLSSFLPFSIKEVLLPIRVVLALETIGLSFYSFLRKGSKDAFLFGFSLVCFTTASIGMAHNIPGLSVFSFAISYVFLSLIFMRAEEKEGLSSYFVLKKKLEETERKLRLSEEKYRVIVENTSDVIMLNNPKGIITYVSPSCKKLFGYEANEFIGKAPWELKIIHPEDVEKTSLHHRELRYSSDGKTIEYRIITKDGSVKWISHSISTVKDEEGKVVVFISSYRDVTERKKMEEELSIKVKELEKAKRAYLNIMEDLEELNRNLEKKVQERTEEVKKLLEAKEELLIQISHDIKTPLTPLCTLLPLARELSDNPKLNNLMDICIRNVNYMKKLVTETLQLLKIDSIKLIKEDVVLLEQVKELMESYKLDFEKKGIEVEISIEKNIIVRADRIRLREILDNLISNAIKYSKEGGKIEIGAEREGNMVKIFVKDNGRGMTKEELEHVFEEFYKGDKSRHDLASVGIGLAICKKLVEKHGGKIWAESEGIGKGSTFYFTLPAAQFEEVVSTKAE